MIFHCALSQVRGPGAALRYVRERERLLGVSPPSKGAEETTKQGSEAEDATPAATGPKEQKVYVLEDGFVGWVQKYAGDARLTEGYRKELWKNGYNY